MKVLHFIWHAEFTRTFSEKLPCPCQHQPRQNASGYFSGSLSVTQAFFMHHRIPIASTMKFISLPFESPALCRQHFFILGFSLNSASQSQHDGTPHVAAKSVWMTADDSVKIWADVLKPRSSMWKFFWKLAESRKLSWNLMQPLAGGEQPLLPLDVMLLPVPSRLKLWALCAQWIGY